MMTKRGRCIVPRGRRGAHELWNDSGAGLDMVAAFHWACFRVEGWRGNTEVRIRSSARIPSTGAL